MAFNAFTSIALTGTPGNLVAKGESRPAHDGEHEIHVAILAVADPDNKRCEGIVADPNADQWIANIPNPEDNPFELGEAVYVVGASQSPGEAPFLWVNELTIDPKIG